MYEDIKNVYEEIRKAKETFNNEVLKVIKSAISEADTKATEEKLGPIETFIQVMKKVNETIENIKNECKLDSEEPLDDNLMEQIFDLTDPYEKKMEEGIQKIVDHKDQVTTLGELLEKNNELEKIVSDISEFLYYPGDIEIRKK